MHQLMTNLLVEPRRDELHREAEMQRLAATGRMPRDRSGHGLADRLVGIVRIRHVRPGPVRG
jgi:hypothetical protein